MVDHRRRRLLACAAAAVAFLVLPVVAHAQTPPGCPSDELPELASGASDELRELRALREDLRSQCDAVDARLESGVTVAPAEGSPLPVTATTALPVDVADEALEVSAPEWLEPMLEDGIAAVWVLIGVTIGVFLGGLVWRAVIR